MKPNIVQRGAALLLSVRTVPRSGRNAIDGVHGDALRVRVAAAPVDGAANEAVIDVLASALGVAPSALEIVRGNRSRNKIVSIRGLSRDDLEKHLNRVCP